MKSWRKIALGMLFGKALMISFALIPWGHFSDSALQIKSEKERTKVVNEDRSCLL